MKEHVAGFAIDDHKNVLLIEKNRPQWQAGLINGIGGKIEAGETALEAMVREFREETGGITFQEQWQHYLTLHSSKGIVHFFRTFMDRKQLAMLGDVGGLTDERVIIRNLPQTVAALLEDREDRVIPSLSYLLTLAAFDNDELLLISIVESSFAAALNSSEKLAQITKISEESSGGYQ
jgi:ADP-ribose pyrophosphatase YjhB (NUDIX family)